MRRTIAILFFLTSLLAQAGEQDTTLLPDSSNFVTASLVTATPTDVIYSSLGHCSLRMQCPSEGLDYFFSLEVAADPSEYMRFFSGQSKAAVVAVPSDVFINTYAGEGRGLTAYELNLTLREKQKLWRILDEEVVKPPHLTFDFLNTNCVMMSLMMIENALIDEEINFGQLPDALQLDNGDLIRYHSRHTPWAQFLYITMSGSACDGHYQMEYRLSPEMIVEVLSGATIQGDSLPSRPVFVGQPRQLIPQHQYLSSSPITPTLVFGILFILVAVLSALQLFWGVNHPVRVFDILLLLSQTVIGLLLLYTSLTANLFGAQWNWYLIPFNPLPALLWLVLHRHPSFWKIYGVYTIILIAFILATPLSSQLDLPHQFVTGILAVRTLTLYITGRRKKKLLS